MRAGRPGRGSVRHVTRVAGPPAASHVPGRMLSRWLNVAIGVWLVLAAFVLSRPGDPARTVDAAAGAALVAISLLAPGTRAGFSAIVLGSWLMIAPSALAYPSVRAAVLDVLTGLAVVAVALHSNLGQRSAARA